MAVEITSRGGTRMANRVLSCRQLILPAVILGNPNEGLETTGFAGHIELVSGG